MPRPTGLVAGQGLTWTGAPTLDGAVAPGARLTFLDHEGDLENLVVSYRGTVFCCALTDVRADPQPIAADRRRHSGPG